MDISAIKTENAELQLEAARTVAKSFVLALKNYTLYSADHPNYLQAVSRLYNDLERLLSSHGELEFAVKNNSLLYKGEVAHHGPAQEGNIAFSLYRDGIRWLRFQEGIGQREIREFVRILDHYKIVPAEADGDLVTALWEAQLPHLEYEAMDFIDAEADSQAGISISNLACNPYQGLLAKETPNAFNGKTSNLVSGKNLNTSKSFPCPKVNYQFSPDSAAGGDGTDKFAERSLELTIEEAALLERMIIEEEERDPTGEVLDMLADTLRHQQDEEILTVVLKFLKEQLRAALQQIDMELAQKIFQRLYLIRRICEKDRSWALPQIDGFFEAASSSQFLGGLHEAWSRAEPGELARIKRFLLLLPPKAIHALAPMLQEVNHPQLVLMITDAITSLATRDLNPLETLLASTEANLAQRLVHILGDVEGDESARILLSMVHHPSELVRREIIRVLIKRDIWVPEKVFHLNDDKSSFVRQLLLKYLGSRKCEVTETLLLNYLQRRKHPNSDKGHLFACFRALGRCGSARSIPFLHRELLEGGWMSRFRNSASRQGAAIALQALGTQETRQILAKAARSPYPALRNTVANLEVDMEELGDK